MKKSSIIFFGAIVFFSLVFTRGQKLVPAVRAGGETLSVRGFFKDRDGLARFRNLSRERVSDTELDRGVISSFVQDALIKEELSRRGFGQDEVEKYVLGTLRPQDEAKLSEAIRELYGWSVEDFKRFVLYPQARRLMLVREFSREKTDGAGWLEKALKDAKISIYLPRWRWEQGEVRERY